MTYVAWTLSEVDMESALLIGGLRQVRAISGNRQDKIFRQGNIEDKWAQHIEGAAGEICVARFFRT